MKGNIYYDTKANIYHLITTDDKDSRVIIEEYKIPDNCPINM